RFGGIDNEWAGGSVGCGHIAAHAGRQWANNRHADAQSTTGRRPIYLARFQVVVAGPPTDALALIYFSSSWLKVTRDRFCSVPFQLGNVAVSSLKDMILSVRLME